MVMLASVYHNPYADQSFLSFFWVLLQRVFGFVTGEDLELYSDEIQLLVLSGVAVSCALVGTFLVLRKMTMLANALSHTILLGIVIAYVITQASGSDPNLNTTAMLIASLGMGLLTTFLVQFLTKTIGLQEDSSIGLVFTSLFAAGVLLVTLLTRNAHIGVEVVMGDADALLSSDVNYTYMILAINVGVFMLCFKEYKITTFDPGLARIMGVSTLAFDYLLMVQVSATSIGAFRAVGVLMVLALITGPVLTARMLTDDLKRMMGLAALLGVLASVLGVATARHLLTTHLIALSTGGLVVTYVVAIYSVAILVRFFAPHTPEGVVADAGESV